MQLYPTHELRPQGGATWLPLSSTFQAPPTRLHVYIDPLEDPLDPVPSSRARQLSVPEGVAQSHHWDAHKDEIIKLYKRDGRTLASVRKHMLEKHGFKATERMYKTRFNLWGIKKNRPNLNSTRRGRKSSQSNPAVDVPSPDGTLCNGTTLTPRSSTTLGPVRSDELQPTTQHLRDPSPFNLITSEEKILHLVKQFPSTRELCTNERQTMKIKFLWGCDYSMDLTSLVTTTANVAKKIPEGGDDAERNQELVSLGSKSEALVEKLVDSTPRDLFLCFLKIVVLLQSGDQPRGQRNWTTFLTRWLISQAIYASHPNRIEKAFLPRQYHEFFTLLQSIQEDPEALLSLAIQAWQVHLEAWNQRIGPEYMTTLGWYMELCTLAGYTALPRTISQSYRNLEVDLEREFGRLHPRTLLALEERGIYTFEKAKHRGDSFDGATGIFELIWGYCDMSFELRHRKFNAEWHLALIHREMKHKRLAVQWLDMAIGTMEQIGGNRSLMVRILEAKMDWCREWGWYEKAERAREKRAGQLKLLT